MRAIRSATSPVIFQLTNVHQCVDVARSIAPVVVEPTGYVLVTAPSTVMDPISNEATRQLR